MIAVRTIGRVTIVSLSGNVAIINDQAVRRRLLETVRAAKFVVVDISGLAVFDWDDVGVLVAARRAHRSRWGTHMHLFKVVAKTGPHRQIIEATHVENILAAYRSLAEALASFPTQRALLVEPDDSAAAVAEIMLEANGFEVVRVRAPEEALRERLDGDFDFILAEIMFAGKVDGDVVRRLKIEWAAPVGVVTSASDTAVLGAAFVHAKSDNPARLIERLRSAMERPLHEYYEVIFDAIDAPLLVVSPDGGVARLNRSWREMFGLLPDQRVCSIGEAFPANFSRLPQVMEQVGSIARAGGETVQAGEWGEGPARQPLHLRLTGLVPPGRQPQVLVRVEKAAGPAGEKSRPAGFEVLLSILEDLDATRVELAKTNEKLRVADSLKDEFVATLSHELRTPLAAILGSLENLDDGILGELNERQQSSIEVALRNSWRLARLIENLLDLSRLERGTLVARRTAIDVRSPVRNAVEELRTLAERSGIRVTAELPADEVPVLTDPDHISQVMVNLIDNALRFSRTQVRVRLTSGDGYARIAVQDDGPGIPEQYRRQIFERFSVVPGRADKSRTGLGLTIVHGIVTACHGKVWVEGNDGENNGGACFIVQLPLAEQNDGEDDGAPEIPPAAAPVSEQR